MHDINFFVNKLLSVPFQNGKNLITLQLSMVSNIGFNDGECCQHCFSQDCLCDLCIEIVFKNRMLYWN